VCVFASIYFLLSREVKHFKNKKKCKQEFLIIYK
jgi:hypothetical protein